MHELVKDYYGKQLSGSADLKTTACCDASSVPAWLKPLLAKIHPEVLERYYGCGLVAPPLLAGCRVLDLGSGSGRDVYALAQLAGPGGVVVGVDMTDEQLAVAERHRPYHAESFGFNNVRFLHGYIERLDELPLETDCEDYGQAVVYRGTMAEHAEAFVLDKHHRIEAGRVFPVCGNTYRMLKESRLAPHFDFIGDGSHHYGIFAGCGKAIPFGKQAPDEDDCGCC